MFCFCVHHELSHTGHFVHLIRFRFTSLNMSDTARLIHIMFIHVAVYSCVSLQILQAHVMIHRLSVFDGTTKRNDETKWRNELTKSLNDNTGFCVVGIVQILYFTKYGSGLDTEWYQAIIYVRCCFPNISHVNKQGVKPHTVGNYSARPVLKDIQLE